jgi:hypothetical protein
MATMKALGDNVIVTRQMRSALSAGIDLWSIEVYHRVVHLLS